MHPFTRRNPKLQAALEAHQAVADRQARRWLERELRTTMRQSPLEDYRRRQNERRESWLGWNR